MIRDMKMSNTHRAVAVAVGLMLTATIVYWDGTTGVAGDTYRLRHVVKRATTMVTTDDTVVKSMQCVYIDDQAVDAQCLATLVGRAGNTSVRITCSHGEFEVACWVADADPAADGGTWWGRYVVPSSHSPQTRPSKRTRHAEARYLRWWRRKTLSVTCADT